MSLWPRFWPTLYLSSPQKSRYRDILLPPISQYKCVKFASSACIVMELESSGVQLVFDASGFSEAISFGRNILRRPQRCPFAVDTTSIVVVPRSAA